MTNPYPVGSAKWRDHELVQPYNEFGLLGLLGGEVVRQLHDDAASVRSALDYSDKDWVSRRFKQAAEIIETQAAALADVKQQRDVDLALINQLQANLEAVGLGPKTNG